MTLGEKVVYKCRMGIKTDAWVRAVRPDGSVDIGADVGSRDLHELTRIKVVELANLRPGTCARGDRNGER